MPTLDLGAGRSAAVWRNATGWASHDGAEGHTYAEASAATCGSWRCRS